MTTQRKGQTGARIQITDIMDFLVSDLSLAFFNVM